jgi:hypothetical protein
MAERGRAPGFKMTEEHRVKIQNSNILSALIEHVSGNREMSSTQVTAGLGLLKKCLPDLSATTISGDPDNPIEFVNLDTPTRARALAAFVAKTKQK